MALAALAVAWGTFALVLVKSLHQEEPRGVSNRPLRNVPSRAAESPQDAAVDRRAACDVRASDGRSAAPDQRQRPDVRVAPKTRQSPRQEGRTIKIDLMPRAQVTIDGKPAGDTPMVWRSRAGKHRITVSNPTLGLRKTVVNLKPKDVYSPQRWPK